MNKEELFQQLIAMTVNGQLDIDQINDFTFTLKQALRQSQRVNRSPELYTAAAEKGKATRIKNVMDLTMSVNQTRERDIRVMADMKIRMDNGLLPLHSDDYSGKPNPKYYEYDHDDMRSGISYYNLKNEYKNVVVKTDKM
jgi:hypothetical protein